MKSLITALILSLGLVAATTANAALVSRLGGLAYYDTVLDITWLQDANYAQTSGYNADGAMTWAAANAWAASLTVAGIGGWRLPDTNPVDGAAFDYNLSFDGSTDYGYNISAPGTIYAGSTGSEMAYMSYNNLGNLGYCDTAGACPQIGWGLGNTGPFSNVQFSYWSATGYTPDTDDAWFFAFNGGYQSNIPKTTGTTYAWAVHSGDVGASTVPVPAAAWLFGSGLMGLAAVVRRKSKEQA